MSPPTWSGKGMRLHMLLLPAPFTPRDTHLRPKRGLDSTPRLHPPTSSIHSHHYVAFPESWCSSFPPGIPTATPLLHSVFPCAGCRSHTPSSWEIRHPNRGFHISSYVYHKRIRRPSSASLNYSFARSSHRWLCCRPRFSWNVERTLFRR